jgi:photosystem II stability/assembly factor-like uncharacterized protein
MSTSPAPQFSWRRTNAPFATSRTDDIWFLDADNGWAVNSNGQVLQTSDGGDSWQQRLLLSNAYLRCVGFANAQSGWVGSLTPGQRLFHTADGGANWTALDDQMPAEAPPAICGLSVVSDEVVYGSGTNFPDKPTGVIKTTDGGTTWTAQSMAEHATLLVDCFFRDEQTGWVVGGKADVPNPRRDDVHAVVLHTEDGGKTWENRLAGVEGLPDGEWGWKIAFVDDMVGYVSLENLSDGAVLKTTDGGKSWTRKPVNDPQDNANLEGIGFVDDQLGWAGGWGDKDFEGGFTSVTHDGGDTWADANEVGKYLNRFRFIREPELVAYASGDTVYKYSSDPNGAPAGLAATREDAYQRTTLPVRIPVDPQPGAESVRVDVWDRFGRHMATPLEESSPSAGTREATWGGETEEGGQAGPGIYIYRVSVDDHVESGTLLVEG